MATELASQDAYSFTLAGLRGVTFEVTFREQLAAHHPRHSPLYLVVARADDQAIIGAVALDAKSWPVLLPTALHFAREVPLLAPSQTQSAKIPLPPHVQADLARWLAVDFPNQIKHLLARLQVGEHVSDELRAWWHYTLVRIAGLSAWEGLSGGEVAEAFHLTGLPSPSHAMDSAATDPRWADANEGGASTDGSGAFEASCIELFSTGATEVPYSFERWRVWCESHLSGLVASSVIPAPVRRAVDLHGATTFTNVDPAMRVTYAPVSLGRCRGYVAYYARPDTAQRNDEDDLREAQGEAQCRPIGPSRHRIAQVAWVPPAIAEAWYADRWARLGSPTHALEVLGRILFGGGLTLWDDDYYRWVFNAEGTNALVSLARQSAPVPFRGTVGLAALASKWFHIPVAVVVPLSLGPDRPTERVLVGFGDPTCTRASELAFYGSEADQSAEREIERELRLHGWVSREQEPAATAWPTAEDLLALQARVRQQHEDAWSPGWA